MNTEFTNKKLSLEEMQELLPDYTFEKLSQNEHNIFENNLQFYPELIDEINEVKSVFHKINEMNYDRFLAERTRNLSVKVNATREKRKFQQTIGIKKYVLPIVIMMLVAFIVGEYKLPDFTSFLRTKESTAMISPKEMAVLITDDQNDMLNLLHNDSQNEDLALAFDKTNDFEELVSDFLENDYEKSWEYFDMITRTNPANKDMLERTFNKNDISENEFQNLIQELGNEKFN